MNRIEVIIDFDKLSRQIYTFWLRDISTLYLDRYDLQLRKSVRHEFKTVEQYIRLDDRNSTVSIESITLFPEIIHLAKQQVINQLQVKKWSKE